MSSAVEETKSPRASPQQQPPTSLPPNPTLILFARGVIARLELWPALRIAVEQGWGGPDSRAKRRWLASVLVDSFDYEQQQQPDAEYVALMLAQVLEDEFGASIEDGSVEAVAADVVKLWGAGEDAVREWELKADGARAKRVDVREVVDEDGDDDDDEEWEDEEEDGDEDEEEEEAPQLLRAAGDPPQRPSKTEPVVDEDGFTLIQKGRR
jgi:pre-rRNA-processing protein TSR2